MITRTDHHQRYANGVLVSDVAVVVDITAEVVQRDIRTKLRAYLGAAEAFLANASPSNVEVVAQERRNTRAIAAIIRDLIGDDLLTENTDT